MELVEILARELKEWPKGYSRAVQNGSSGGKCLFIDDNAVEFSCDQWDYVLPSSKIYDEKFYTSEASDYKTAIVTRADWKAERARIAKPAKKADKDGWIRHCGGKCPVDAGVLVDVRLRKKGDDRNGEEAGFWDWTHSKHAEDVMYYRLHSPAQQLIEPVVVENVQAFNGYDFKSLEPLGGPIHWRDRIRDIDSAVEALEEERVSLIQRLESEGLQLLQGKVCGSVEPVADMSDWCNWEVGDLVRLADGRYEETGMEPGSSGVITEIDEEDECGQFIKIDDYYWPATKNLIWVSRPSA